MKESLAALVRAIGRALTRARGSAGPRVQPADRERRLDDLAFVVFDTETTGLKPGVDRIVSLAGIRIASGAVASGERFDALVDPGRPIPPASTRLHGIADAMVAGAPPLDAVLLAFLEFAGSAVLVGHDVWFDLAFLRHGTERLGRPAVETTHTVLDTRLIARSLYGLGAGGDLDAVAARVGVTVRGRHTAAGDALATAEVLVALLGLARARGIGTLGQMVALGGGGRAARRGMRP